MREGGGGGDVLEDRGFMGTPVGGMGTWRGTGKANYNVIHQDPMRSWLCLELFLTISDLNKRNHQRWINRDSGLAISGSPMERPSSGSPLG